MIAAVNVDEVRGTSKISAFNSNSEGIPATPKRVVTKRELAAVYSVCQRTVDNWVAKKIIPRLRLSARLTRFDLPKVEAALARYEIREVGARS
jgi:hypothetical protein